MNEDRMNADVNSNLIKRPGIDLFSFKPLPEAVRPDLKPVRISNLDKAALLQALHAAAIHPGGGFSQPITRAVAETLIDDMGKLGVGLIFLTVRDRVLNVDISGDTLDPTRYDQANRIHPADGTRDVSLTALVVAYLRKELTHVCFS